MLGPYRQVLAKPGATAFTLAGAIGRLPISMVTLSIILLVTNIYGQYQLAGSVSAAYVAAQAIGAPQLAKLIDVHGQSKIMRPAILCAAASFVALLWSAYAGWPTWTLFVTAAIGGLSIGSLGALVRARWALTVTTPRDLHVAFSLESAIDELLFVVGPMLATILATEFSPAVSLIVAIVAALGGGLWFLSQGRTEPPPRGPSVEGQAKAPLWSGSLVVVGLVFLAMGSLFGAADVATVAVTKEAGKASIAGVLLGVMALGSLISGLWYGTRHFRSALWQRFVVGIVALAVAAWAFLAASNLWVLALVMFLVGFGIAPTLIAGNAIVQLVAPPERLTEGLTWVATAVGLGFAIGTPIAGSLVDANGGHAGYWVCLAGSAFGAIVVACGIPILRRQASEPQYGEPVPGQSPS